MPTPAASEAEVMQGRIARARALTAAHNLAAAITELDAIRSRTTDDSIRDVARIMLMNIYLEEGDYTRADALLVESFKARSPQNESSVQSYFALAGQTISGARAHLERYRTFGINVADKSLPQEALNDLDRLRLLLERIADQSKEIGNEDERRNDAVALLEDVASVRGSLARDEEDRLRWRQEFAAARQKLAASETRIASIGGIPSRPSIIPASSGSPRANNTGPVSQPAAPSTNASQPASTAKQPAAPSGSNNPASSKPSAPTQQGQTQRSTSGETAAAGDSPLEVGALLDKAVQKVNPIYPAMARNAHVAGLVTVFLLIDENGAVVKVERVSGPQLLQQAAIEAARKWKFRPTSVDGQPVRVSGFINFNFTM
ncbi:MAG TPA: TonB family protein [Pyrinomonadaceae bacterium]